MNKEQIVWAVGYVLVTQELDGHKEKIGMSANMLGGDCISTVLDELKRIWVGMESVGELEGVKYEQRVIDVIIKSASIPVQLTDFQVVLDGWEAPSE